MTRIFQVTCLTLTCNCTCPELQRTLQQHEIHLGKPGFSSCIDVPILKSEQETTGLGHRDFSQCFWLVCVLTAPRMPKG